MGLIENFIGLNLYEKNYFKIKGKSQNVTGKEIYYEEKYLN